jgi:hypothetical protein
MTSKNHKEKINISYRARTLCKDGYKWLDWTDTFDPQTGTMYAAARDISKLVENQTSLKRQISFKLTFDILSVTKEMTSSTLHLQNTWLQPKDITNITWTSSILMTKKMWLLLHFQRKTLQLILKIVFCKDGV